MRGSGPSALACCAGRGICRCATAQPSPSPPFAVDLEAWVLPAAGEWILPRADAGQDRNRGTLAHVGAAVGGVLYTYEPQTGSVEHRGDVRCVLGMRLTSACASISVRSEGPGLGSEFVLTLPIGVSGSSLPTVPELNTIEA